MSAFLQQVKKKTHQALKKDIKQKSDKYCRVLMTNVSELKDIKAIFPNKHNNKNNDKK